MADEAESSTAPEEVWPCTISESGEENIYKSRDFSPQDAEFLTYFRQSEVGEGRNPNYGYVTKLSHAQRRGDDPITIVAAPGNDQGRRLVHATRTPTEQNPHSRITTVLSDAEYSNLILVQARRVSGEKTLPNALSNRPHGRF
jgi:hypothetical protein